MTEARKPAETPTPRMESLARLPVFYALTGKRVLVVGGGAMAAWKVELLSAVGANVDVIGEEVSDEMRSLAHHAPHGPIVLHERAWRVADLFGASMAIGDFSNDGEAARFAAAARSHGVPVNVIDKPKFCDFSFGAIVNRSPLVIGISTDGGAPVFGQAIRAKLEAMLPQGFARWADAARQWRAAVKSSGLSFEARRRFWQLFTAQAIREPVHEPSEADFAALLAEANNQARQSEAGSVTLVGAGPGDPELLTLRAVRALQSADVILFDDLVSREVLDFSRREAKKLLVGKTGYGPACKQDDINALMVSLAKAGRRVVRLKGGDPLIFGRATEEIEACRAANIATDIVPGITSAQGAAARLGVSLTERVTARRVQYITGHDRDGSLPPDIEWTSVADPAATTVVYMPKRTLGELTAKAIARGLDPATPAVVIFGATRTDETIVTAPVSHIAGKIAEMKIEGPALVLIGKAMAGAMRDGILQDETKHAV
jgi:uroporphyrin-III C-methyltransferase/precorrin-2 dehydrogenase/sirohydrochlorin ferrochelatase